MERSQLKNERRSTASALQFNSTGFKQQAPSPCAVKGDEMVYHEKVVAAIKVSGQVLREAKGVVTLPFGCEFSILVKNLNSVRIQSMVSVDGREVTNRRLVIAPNSSLELERFIRNGNLRAGNRFKFIERTREIEEHRGLGVDDGIVRIESWTEHVPKFVDAPIPRYRNYPVPIRWLYYPHPHYLHYPRRPTPRVTAASLSPRAGAARTRRPSDVGITVAGSESHQKFYSVDSFELDLQSTVIVLRLRGRVGKHPVNAPLSVKSKLVCSSCGRTNKTDADFCSRCGTALKLI
jgi:hypothetical protein